MLTLVMPNIRRHCDKCKAKTLHVYDGADDEFYFVLSVLTLGVAFIFWFRDLFNKLQRAKCIECSDVIDEVWK